MQDKLDPQLGYPLQGQPLPLIPTIPPAHV